MSPTACRSCANSWAVRSFEAIYLILGKIALDCWRLDRDSVSLPPARPVEAVGPGIVQGRKWIDSRISKTMSTTSSNFIPALVSFFIPGLGQLIQGRLLAALLYFVISAALWFFFLGWLGHIVSCIDAARWRAR